MERRAQSESIGVILLTVVVIIITTVGGAVVLGGVAEDADSGSAPLVYFSVEITADNVTITHAGGDVITQSELTVIVRGDDTTDRYSFDGARVGDGDGRFEPSERFLRDHNIAGQSIQVTVVHDASNTVLARESATVSEPEGRSPTARFSATPDDPDPDETVTLDASASDDTDGTIVEYRWDFGDGNGATTTESTVTHNYDSAGTYRAELTVTDDSGDTDTATTEVVVSAPEIRIDSAALLETTDDDGVVGPSQSVTVTATVSASGTTVETVTADASAFGVGTQTLSDENEDGVYEATFDVRASATDGPQQLTVTATDAIGTSGSATTGTLTVDTTPPTVERFEVTDESGFVFFGTEVNYQIDWSVSDESLAATEIYINRTDDSDNPQRTFPGSSGLKTYSQGGPFQLGGLGQVHEIKLVATDKAGNRQCVVVTDTANGSPDGPLEYSACG